MIELVLSVVIGAVLLTATIVLYKRRKKVERRGAEALRLSIAEGQSVPLSLHPVIDPTLCVGSFSCIKACPEGEIIGVVDGVATLVQAAHCIGHSRCAVECPVGAIKLVFGTAERGVDLPDADEAFESTRPGVYVIGELGGMGLIKNALHQGLVIGRTLKGRLKKSEANQQLTDVVVVGGGPAGIACAVACREVGLGVRVLEQGTLGGTVAHYPRGKVVMTEQIVMPGYGPFGRSLLSKEELLDDLKELVRANRIEIEEGEKVVGVAGDAPFLSVRTATDKTIQCRAVVLAIGLRGSPRTLGVPGEDLPKVTYRLVEPEQYHGKRVLVVGGGDSAVEAAIQLAEESTAQVTISYRQAQFARCKPRNKEKIKQLIDDGRIKALFSTQVRSIEPGVVRLMPAGAEVPAAAKESSRSNMLRQKITEASVEFETTDPEGQRPKLEEYDRKAVTGSFKARPIVTDPGVGGMRTLGVEEIERSTSSQRAKPKESSRPRQKTNTSINVGQSGRVRTIEGGAEVSGSSKSERPSVPGEVKVKNDNVIISAGGQLPTEFLKTIGVGTRRYHGDEKSGAGVGPKKGSTKAEVEARSRRRLAFTLFLLGASIIASLLLIGQRYYWLPLEERVVSPLHPLLKPSGLWGHGVGVVATTFMIANFVYALRKRWRKLKGKASIRTWLTFHMFVGIMSPLVIAFHAAFLLNNLLAVWTWLALTVVVGTGIFGRFLFGFVPAQAGKMLAVSDLRDQVNDIGAVLEPHIKETTNIAHVTQIFDMAKAAPGERKLMQAVLRERTVKRKLMNDIDGARGYFKDAGAFNLFKESVLQISRAKMQISFYAALKRVFRTWLVVHVVVAIFMVVLIGAHVGVTTYLGFRWIFGAGG